MHWIALLPDTPAGMPTQAQDAQAVKDAHTAQALPADPLTALAWQALQFTPKVARVALTSATSATSPAPPEALLMEVSASERLFGGRRALLAQLFKENGPFVHVKRARSATSLIAIARLQLMPPLPAADDLPLATLAAARPHLATLARVGCTTWGELRALPRGGVVRRFGAELLDALDRAYGLKPEIYPWLTLPEVFDEKIELHAQVETAPALMFGAQRLLKQLQLWLQLRNVGVSALEFGWTMDARRGLQALAGQTDASKGALGLRTAEATQDITHLQRLLGENLARLSLPAPALYLHLRTLQTEALATRSAPLLLDDAQKGDSLHQMLERLSARLGPEAVKSLQTRADHRPEISQNYDSKLNNLVKYNKNAIINVSNNAINTRTISIKNINNLSKINKNDTLHPDVLCPTWLLHPPLALAVLHHTPHYHGPLTLLAGPQRLEAGWFDTTALRDYFIAQSEQAGLLWVFCERLGARVNPGPPQQAGLGGGGGGGSGGSGARWFLQGLFD